MHDSTIRSHHRCAAMLGFKYFDEVVVETKSTNRLTPPRSQIRQESQLVVLLVPTEPDR